MKNGLIRIVSSTDGKALEVHLQRSSGQRSFDDAARRQAQRTWRFRPAIRDGMPVAMPEVAFREPVFVRRPKEK